MADTRPIAIRGWIIFYASLIHMTWAVTLLLSSNVVNVAPVNRVAEWLDFDQYATAASYFGVAVLAAWGSARHKYNVIAPLLGLPQLLLVLLGTAGCIDIVMDGVHPDGTTGQYAFFFAQLAGSIWLGPVYMVAVYWPYWRALWTQRK